MDENERVVQSLLLLCVEHGWPLSRVRRAFDELAASFGARERALGDADDADDTGLQYGWTGVL